jgi:predicted transcriptional regulator
MRNSEQIRAARALLGLRQDELAKDAGVGLATLQRIEQQPGQIKGNFSTVMKIQQTLERGGIQFIDEDGTLGVLMRPRSRRR